MACLRLESFDVCDNAHLDDRWTQVVATQIGPQFGRNGNGCFIGPGGGIAVTLPYVQECIIGCALNINPNFNGTVYEVSALSGNRSLSTLALLTMMPDGTFGIYAGDNQNGSLIDNPRGYVYSALNYIFWELKLSFSAGGMNNTVQVTATFKVNGQILTSGMSGDSFIEIPTLLGQLPQVSFHNFLCPSNNGCTVDDLYIFDTSGDQNNDFAGDNLIGAIFPRADVEVLGYAPLTGSALFPMINEKPPASPAPDDDATYIFDETLFDKYTCNYDLVSSLVGQIQCAQFSIYGRKDDEGSRAVVPIFNRGDYEGPTTDWFYLSNSYRYHIIPYDVDPVTGNPWSVALINGTDAGVETVL